jgi:hypothetical protein
MAPLRDACRVDQAVEAHAVSILAALRQRDPEAVEDALSGEMGARPLLREGIARSSADVSPEQSLSLNFDQLIVLPEEHRAKVAAIFEAALSARSLSTFLATVLSTVADELLQTDP